MISLHGLSHQGLDERVSLHNSCRWACGSYSPQPTLVLDAKPVDKHGSEVRVQVSGDVHFGGDPVQEFARLVTSGRGFRQKDPNGTT
jgi:hypothetical protein